MTLVSPPASTANQYRDAIAGGGGSAFYLGLGRARRQQRAHGGHLDEAGRGGLRGTPPTPPTPTATATPTTATATRRRRADRDAPNRSTPAADAGRDAGAAARTRAPSAIADFTTLPAASQCVRNRKLTVRMKRPPKGYTVKTVTVKVNAKRVATLKGRS